jgi:diadenosine tetraphosphate (Ap4A) HIT family hydrolase
MYVYGPSAIAAAMRSTWERANGQAVCVSQGPSPITLNPVTVIEFGDVWTIALNRNQNLLGKTMLVLQRPCAAVTELRTDEWVELHRQLRRVCAALDALFAPDLYNHAFLMNEHRQVHLHVVPRYKSERSWSGATFTDQRWGAVFGGDERRLSDEDLSALADVIRSRLACA